MSDASKAAGVKTIASPKIMTRTSPIQQLTRDLNIKLSVDTAQAKNALAKYTQGGGLGGAVGGKGQSPGAAKQHMDCDSPIEEDKTNVIPIANFKSNKLSQMHKKQR